jgi:hypothetical protein
VQTALNGLAIISFKDGQAGVEEVALGNDDDVKTLGDLVSTENLSNQSFGSVPLNSSAELFRSCDAQTSYRALVGKDEHGREAAVHTDASFVNLLKLGAAPDVLGRPEPRQVIRC